MGAPIDMINRTFGRLTVVSFVGVEKRKRIWECVCVCGNSTKQSTEVLMGGDVRSCGCLKKEITSKIFTTHGLSKTKEYGAWLSIKKRCYTKSTDRYYAYGARGITVCDRWLNSFENFVKDVGMAPSNKHSVDRIDVNKNYEPGNVKWSTDIEQANNKRNNHYVTFSGKTQSLSAWAKELGLPYGMIQRRLYRGWSYEECFTIAIQTRRKSAML